MTAKHRSLNNVLWRVVAGRIRRVAGRMRPEGRQLDTPDLRVTELLKQCSQRIYLLLLLRNQGLSTDQLNAVFVGLIVSRLLYALPAWGVLVSICWSSW